MPLANERYRQCQGVVYKKTIRHYFVHSGDRLVPCAISPRLHKVLVYPIADPHSLSHVVREVHDVEIMDPVAVGDEVRFVDTGDGSGLIVEILPRKSWLVRGSPVPMPSQRPIEQVIVANVDQVVPVLSAAQPTPRWNLLDRYLVSAESLELPSVIIVTKMDLDSGDEGLHAEMDSYRTLGYPVLLASAVSGQGLPELREALRNRVSVFIGQSGVGKTSLLNALEPGLGKRVNDVSRGSGKGQHTTTNLEMVPLEAGGGVVDTPGMREFGLWDVERDDLALFFPEMRPYVGKCKFGLNCTHVQEPGCVVLKALLQGKIGQRRYESYLKLSMNKRG